MAITNEERSGLIQDDGRPPIDYPLFLAELFAFFLFILGVILVLAGLGFYTVHPPGEEDLCRIDTLGLQNKSIDEQNRDLQCCHGLYIGVFDTLATISVPLIVCGALALVNSYVLGYGALRRHEEETPRHFRMSIVLDIIGFIVVFFPSIAYPAVAAIVAAGLAPIHAYFITIMVGHVVMGAVNTSSQDEGFHKAVQVEETLYKGYCAASRVEQCLGAGSVCLVALWWLYLMNVVRNLAALFCHKPDYEVEDGSQLMRLKQVWREKCPRRCGGNPEPTTVVE